jgi:hypothetical protein
MKYTLAIFSILFSLSTVSAQQKVTVTGDLHIGGKTKITSMDQAESVNSLVVRKLDGTLATRQVESLPSQTDTTRTFETDIKIAKIACECGISPFLAKSMLAKGYSPQDLLDANVPLATLQNSDVNVSDLLALGFTNEELLNAGYSPIDLNNAGVALTSLYGLSYAGGLIFYIDSAGVYPFDGIVAASSDQPDAWWGCGGFLIGTIGGIGYGEANTALIVENECGNTAADVCDTLGLSGFSNWFLPSLTELLNMRITLHEQGIGNFAFSEYWTSDNLTISDAYGVDFSSNTGYPHWTQVNKNISLKVRAARYY